MINSIPLENVKSTEQDAEILIVGEKAENNPKPSMLIDDMLEVIQ